MNLSIFNFFFSFAHKSVFLDDVIVFFGRYAPYLLGIVFIVFVFEQSDSRRRLFLFGEAVLAVILARGLVTEVIRHLYAHSRPFDALGITALIPESGNSFPSGHMTFFFALALIVWFYDRSWGTWFLVASLVIGIARVASGVHWPADIVGGIVIGVVSAWFVHGLLQDSRKKIFGEMESPDLTASSQQ